MAKNPNLRRPHNFKKGHKKQGGRVAGTPNELNAECKQMLADGFREIGGLKGLVAWINADPDNKRDFYTRMWIRLVGVDLHIKSAHTKLVYHTLDEINARLGEAGLSLETLNRLRLYEKERPKLIEHVAVD